MKIALVSYEYPPDTAFGGIATYVRQTARVLAAAGHQVEVFAGSETRSDFSEEDGYLVTRAKTDNKVMFSQAIAPGFVARNSVVNFDVMEVPDYNADARDIVRLAPHIPMVVKLHTPMFMSMEANSQPLSLYRRLRNHISALKRHEKARWSYRKEDDLEYHHALLADEFAAPCRAIGEHVGRVWKLDPDLISVVPLIFRPDPALLQIPAKTDYKRITFIGRLEIRKGVLDLMEAIPQILAKHPDWRFRLIGRPASSPDPQLNMQEYLKIKLAQFETSVEMTGGIPADMITKYLGETDICVYPSVWENFPCVCLEAMAAGRAIVGSSAGGMADMLAGGKAGRLVPPKRPDAIVAAINDLIESREMRLSLGEAARGRLIAEYDPAKVTELQIASYERAIRRRKTLGARKLA